MKAKKLVSLLLSIMLLSVVALCGCSKDIIIKAELIDDAMPYLSEEYRNIMPKDHINLLDAKEIAFIECQDDLERAFTDFPQAVDFDKEMLMLILFVYEPIYVNGKKHLAYELKNVQLNNDVLHVQIQYKNLDKNKLTENEDYPIGKQLLVVKMEKVHEAFFYSKVQFEYVKL